MLFLRKFKLIFVLPVRSVSRLAFNTQFGEIHWPVFWLYFGARVGSCHKSMCVFPLCFQNQPGHTFRCFALAVFGKEIAAPKSFFRMVNALRAHPSSTRTATVLAAE